MYAFSKKYILNKAIRELSKLSDDWGTEAVGPGAGGLGLSKPMALLLRESGRTLLFINEMSDSEHWKYH